MANFVFTARDQEGKHTSGTVEAASLDSALHLLADRNLLVVYISEKSPRRFFGFKRSSVQGREILAVTQELAALLEAGIPLKSSFEILAEDAESSVMSETLVEIAQGLAAGNSLSELLRQYPKIFSPIYVSMVSVGEGTGDLPGILLRLAAYIGDSENLRKRVRASLYYPAAVLCFAFAIFCLIFIFGIPKVEQIYSDIGARIPIPTLVLISVAHFFLATWPFWVVILIGGITGFRLFAGSAGGRRFLDEMKLRSPVFGPLFKEVAIARFARSLATLYGSGVPILQCMDLIKESTGNTVVEDAIRELLVNLKEGKPITEPLRKSGAFTRMAVSMIAAGEESGSLEKMLNKLAEFYETQVDISIKGLSGLLEPVLMIGVGILIGGVIFALGLPFLNLGGALKK